MGLGEFNGLPPIRRFTDHLIAGLPFQKNAKAGTHHDVVVGQQNPDRLHAEASAGGREIAIRVPRPGSESISKLPPKCETRSCIPSSPRPRISSGLNPRPSSSIDKSRESALWRTI